MNLRDLWNKPWIYGIVPTDPTVASQHDCRWQGHVFPNTGCKRSWCDHCGVVGHYDWYTGSYKAEPK